MAINNRLAGAALSAATGLSQPGITKPKLPPAKGLAMDAATPKAVVQAVTQVQSSVARAAGPSAGSQSRSSTQSGEEAAENVPVLATSGGMRSDHAVAEDAGLLLFCYIYTYLYKRDNYRMHIQYIIYM